MKNALKILLSAALFATGYPLKFGSVITPAIYFLPILGIALLWHLLWKTTSLKDNFKTILFFNVLITLFSFNWIAYTLQEFGDLHFSIAFILNAAFSLIVNSQLWSLILVKKLIHKYQPKLYESNNHSVQIVLWSLIASACEYYTPSQFPIFLGHSSIALSPYLYWGQFGGVMFYSFFSYLIALSISKVIETKNPKTIFQFKVPVATWAFFLSTSFIFHTLFKQQPTDETINIRMVQANISNFLKMESESGRYPSINEVTSRYKELTLKPWSLDPNESPDVIIWPETAYPRSISNLESGLETTIIPNYFKSLSKKLPGDLLFGGYQAIYDKESYEKIGNTYNAFFHFTQQGKMVNIYQKHILIPFGEDLPFGPLNVYFDQIFPNIAFFSKGQTYPLFKMNENVYSIVSICYEILYADFINKYLDETSSLSNRPNFIINLTNDSWYGRTTEPYQHLDIVRWRAVESGLPVLRSTNTGVTALINPYGELTHQTKIFEGLNLDIKAEVYRNPTTLFSKIGFGFTLLISLVLLGLFGIKKKFY